MSVDCDRPVPLKDAGTEMLTATAVPGKNSIVNIAMVFIEAESRILASAIRRDVFAISMFVRPIDKLRRESRCMVRLNICR